MFEVFWGFFGRVFGFFGLFCLRLFGFLFGLFGRFVGFWWLLVGLCFFVFFGRFVGRDFFWGDNGVFWEQAFSKRVFKKKDLSLGSPGFKPSFEKHLA